MSYLSTFRPKFEENMLHLISAPLNLSKYKVLCYREKIGDQKCLVWVLLGQNLKKIRHIWNQHLRICQNSNSHVKEEKNRFVTKVTLNLKRSNFLFKISTLKFIKSLSNFSIGSTFSEGPGSDFSEGLGPGPGALYKVCQNFFSVKWQNDNINGWHN